MAKGVREPGKRLSVWEVRRWFSGLCDENPMAQIRLSVDAVCDGDTISLGDLEELIE